MKRYLIEEIITGESEGGMACGPVEGTVNAAIKYKENGVSKWLTLSEYTGFPGFYLTDEIIIDRLCADDLNDDFIDYLNEHYLEEFEGIQLNEYEDIFRSFAADPENPAVPLIRFLIGLNNKRVRESLIDKKGKYIDEIDVPLTDREEDFLMGPIEMP